jgi:hypothetical protein
VAHMAYNSSSIARHDAGHCTTPESGVQRRGDLRVVYMKIVKAGLGHRRTPRSAHNTYIFQDGFRSSVRPRTSRTRRHVNYPRSIKVRGSECGIEAIILGLITSIGGFLFGYDTVRQTWMALSITPTHESRVKSRPC